MAVGENAPRVLLFITEGSPELEFMLTQEVGVMKEILEKSGFGVDLATVSGESLSAGSFRLDNVLKLTAVNTDIYSGFLFPCLGVQERDVPEVDSLIRKAAEAGKTVAAQTGSVRYLARAGVLNGKKYGYRIEPDLSEFPEFEGGIYCGTGVVQDGNIMTSGVCPMIARDEGLEDGTPRLAQMLIEAIKEER